MRIIGIDPGITGAIALYDTERRSQVFDIPTSPHVVGNQTRQIAALQPLIKRLQELKTDFIDAVFLEQINSWGDDTPLTAWNMSDSYRCVKDALEIAELAVTYVAPLTWQSRINLKSVPKDLPKAKRYALRKERHRERALQLFPELSLELQQKNAHNRADALLIAYYGHCSLSGLLPEKEHKTKRKLKEKQEETLF
jgi:crossover junction endodeoxyribonuclease RuvC